MSFGRYLVQARQLRGLDLGEVAERTKIPVSTLEALEDESGTRLPERVYVLGYLRAYADAVGLDADDVLLRFEEAHPEAKPEAAAPAPEVVTTRRPGLALAAIFGIGAVILAVVLALLLRGH